MSDSQPVIGAVASGLLTGGLAAAISFPASCRSIYQGFTQDCHNVLGFTSLADYPTAALVITLVIGAIAGTVVFFLLRGERD